VDWKRGADQAREALELARSVVGEFVMARSHRSGAESRKKDPRRRISPFASIPTARSSTNRRDRFYRLALDWLDEFPARVQGVTLAQVRALCDGASIPKSSRSSSSVRRTRPNTVRIIAVSGAAASSNSPMWRTLRREPDRVRETLFTGSADLTGQACLTSLRAAGLGTRRFRAARPRSSLIEKNPAVLRALRDNAHKLGATGLTVVRGDALEFGPRLRAPDTMSHSSDPAVPSGHAGRGARSVARASREGGRVSWESDAVFEAPRLAVLSARARGTCIFIFWQGRPMIKRCIRERLIRSAGPPGSGEARRRLFDEIVVGIAASQTKNPFFTVEETRAPGVRGAQSPIAT